MPFSYYHFFNLKELSVLIIDWQNWRVIKCLLLRSQYFLCFWRNLKLKFLQYEISRVQKLYMIIPNLMRNQERILSSSLPLLAFSYRFWLCWKYTFWWWWKVMCVKIVAILTIDQTLTQKSCHFLITLFLNLNSKITIDFSSWLTKLIGRKISKGKLSTLVV